MTRYKILSGATATLLLFPLVSFAQIAEGNAGDLGNAINGIMSLINELLIPFLIALAVLAFVYGVFQYFILGGSDDEKRKAGKQLMLYALIGFVAIIALWGIVNLLVSSLGFTDSEAPTGPQPVVPST